MIRFSAPLLLAFGVPLVLLIAYRLRRLPTEHAGLRRRAIQVAMVGAALCAALAVAGLEVGRRVDRLAVVFALDRSRSVERPGEVGLGQATEQLRRSIETMRPDDKAGVVVFGASAASDLLPSPSPPIGQGRATVPRDATDIGAGIRRALADLPDEHTGRIVIVSDGVETQGDALAAAAVAAGRGVVVDVLPIERAPRPEIAVERVRVPATARPGEPVEVRVITRATRETPVRVRVTRGGHVLAEGQTTIAAGDDVLVMRDVAPDAGVHRYDVLIEPVDEGADVARENNEGGSFMRVMGGSRALVLAGEPAHAGGLVAAMREGGLEVELRDARGVPADLGELAGYDLIVLSDIESRVFSRDQLRAMASYVRDLGGGILMAGARDAFGLGGYAYTPIEEALPATFDLRRRRDRLSLAMIVAIDSSGSMSAEAVPGTTKLDLANEAAARSAMLLSPADRVGVMHVDTEVSWTQPMTDVSDPAAVARACRGAQPGGGGILVDITMEAAYRTLRAERTQLKHFLLFSDGNDSEDMAGTRAQVRQALGERITTSIVSMGAGPDTPELERLSRLGGGRFYIVEDMTELPRIFTQETIEASRAALVEESFRAQAEAPGAATRGIDFSGAPALGGYSVVNARPRATVLLRAADDDPLLAVWQHGIGRSAVFTTDVGAALGRPWLDWAGYSPLFSQLSRDLARAPERRDAQVSVVVRDGVGHVRVEAVSEEGQYRNYLDLAGTVAAPGGRRIDVSLSQNGAGRYEGTFDAATPGPYLVTVREEDTGLVGSAGVVRPAGDELRGEGTDRARLAQIAALTGGVVRTDLAEVFRDRPPTTFSYAPTWPLLLAAAMCLLLLSVALRRLVLPPGLLARLVPQRLRRTTARGPASASSTATLEALQRGKAQRGEVAEELRRAREAQPGDAPSPSTSATGPAEAKEPTVEAPAAPPAAAPPAASLAEQLLARRKRKK